MKFENLFRGCWFVVVKSAGSESEMRIMAKVDSTSAQYTVGVDAKGTMVYERDLVRVAPNTKVIPISRIGILPHYI